MITGYVTAHLEARINLFVEDSGGQTHTIEAAIDTGYSGFLSLRPATIAKMALPWFADRQCLLADGTITRLDVYSAIVIWNSQPRTVEVHAVEMDPTVGMKMLASHELRMRIVDGGLVWIDVVP